MNEWQQNESGYGWTHQVDSKPSGWTIGKYIVNGKPTYLLWQGEQARGGRSYSLKQAMQRQRDILNGRTVDAQQER